MPLTDYTENQLQDHHWRTDAWVRPATHYFGLFIATRGFWTTLTNYSSGDTILPTVSNGRMYRATSSGQSAASEPTWPTVAGASVADGGVVWQEMTPDWQANNAFLDEVTTVASGYARVGVPRGNASFLGTHGTTTGPSSGTGGNIRNAVLIEYGTPALTWGLVGFWGSFDALTAGNLTWYAPLTIPRLVVQGSTPPAFPFGALGITVNTPTSVV
ncbi:MAG: phage tail fiber protein [Egibacteraceae bacterium]